MSAALVPSGFSLWPPRGPFLAKVAQVYVRGEPAAPVFGVRVEEHHCNGRGIAHGGFLSTLADVWTGYILAPKLNPEAQYATSSLTVDFVSPALAGDWLQSETDRVRVGRRVCLVSAAIVNGDRLVALVKGSFVLVKS